MNSAIRSRGRAARAPGPDVGKPLHFEVLQ
jgi:hypothetical protein